MESEIERLIVRLVGDAGEYMKMLQEAQAGAAATAQQVINSASKIEGIAGSIENYASQALAALAAVGAAAKLHLAFGAFSEAESIGIRLNSVLITNRRNVEEVTVSYTRFADAMQAVTTLDDDMVLGLLAQAESFNLTKDAAERAIKDSIALATINRSSAEAMIRITAAMAEGDVERAMMFSRMIPQLRGVKDETVFLARYQALVTGGLREAAAQAKTASGQIKQLGVAYENLMEDFGAVIAVGVFPFVAALRFMVDTVKESHVAIKALIVIVTSLVALLTLLPAAIYLVKLALTGMTASVNLLADTLIGLYMHWNRVMLVMKAGLVIGAVVGIAYLTLALLGAFSAGKELENQLKNLKTISERTLTTLNEIRGRQRENIQSIIAPQERLNEQTRTEAELLRHVSDAAASLEAQRESLRNANRWTTSERELDPLRAMIETNEAYVDSLRTALAQVRGDMVRTAKAIAEGPGKAFKEAFDSINRRANTAGMTPDQVTIFDARKAGVGEGQIAILQFAQANARAREESAALSLDVTDLNDSLQREANTFGMTAREITLYDLEQRGATEGQLGWSRAIMAGIDALEAQAEAVANAKQITEQFRDPLEIMMTRMAELQDLFDGGLLDQGTFDRAWQDAEDTFYGVADSIKAVNKEIQRFDSALAGSVESISRIEAFRELMRMPLNVQASQQATQTIVAAVNRPADRQLDSDAAWRAGVLTQLTQSNTYLSRIVNRPAPQPAGI